MGIGIITSLIVFPIVIALILLVTKGGKAKKGLAAFSTVVMTGGAIALVVLYFGSREKLFGVNFGILSYAAMAVEVLLVIIIVYICLKRRKYFTAFLALFQTAVLVVFQFIKGNDITIEHNLYVDRFSIIVLIITTLIGGLIAVYTSGYLVRFHRKNDKIKNKSAAFCAAVFMSIAAVIGLVVCNNVSWMYIFWEIIATSLCYMITYGKEGKAFDNAFKFMTFNMLGGVAFVIGIVVLGGIFGTFEFSTAIFIGSVYGDVISIPAAFIGFAALVMALQMPFSGWFVNSGDILPPASALVSSVISLNAGVFLIFKMSPVLGIDNFTGIMVMMIGGITFITSSFAAVSQTDIRKVTSYMTLAVSGIIIICGGIGSAEALWAGIMLLIFHSVIKPLMIISSGKACMEYEGVVKDIGEVFVGRPRAAVCMLTAVGAMFIVLFEIFLLNWTAVGSVADSGNIVLISMLCFGGGAVIFVYARWIGKLALAASLPFDDEKDGLGKVAKILWALMIFICAVFPLISIFAVEPYIKSAFGGVASVTDVVDIVMGIIVILFVLLLSGVFYGKKKNFNMEVEERVTVSEVQPIKENGIFVFFNEKRINKVGFTASVVMMVVGMGFIIGTLVNLLGGVS